MVTSFAVSARRLTSGAHHFFGYYDKSPWNASGRFHLGLRVGFAGRLPRAEDTAIVGLIDTRDDNRWIALAETQAWSWQQGAMLQWAPSAPEDAVLYNIRRDGAFKGVIRNVVSGETREYDHAIYAASTSHALSLSFVRLSVTRPDCGYAGLSKPKSLAHYPRDDGVWLMDLSDGRAELIVSLDQLARIDHRPEMDEWPTWVNHLTFSPRGTKIAFLNRFLRHDPKRPFQDRFFIANPDGTGLTLLHDREYFSHFCFLSETRILGYGRDGDGADNYILFDLETGSEALFAPDHFDTDGHCSYSPDRRWLLTDTYPDRDHLQTLILYDTVQGRRIDIGRFFAPPDLVGPVRCDLHPRWDREGRKVSIDSAHAGARQIYELDISAVLATAEDPAT